MTSISSSLAHRFGLSQPISRALDYYHHVNADTARSVLNKVKDEATGMSKNFVIGSLFAKFFGFPNPYSFATVNAFAMSAGPKILPKFYQQFHCTPDTRIRNIVVHAFADLTTTAVANYAAYQVGCTISPEAIIMMKAGTVLIPTVLKAIDTPLQKLPELLPELVTTIALSLIIGTAAHNAGYTINPAFILRQQISMLATSLYAKKSIDTGQYFHLKELLLQNQNNGSTGDTSELPFIPVDHPSPSHESPRDPPIQLTEAQIELLKTPEGQIVKSQLTSTIIFFLYLYLAGRFDEWYFKTPDPLT